MNGFRRKKKPAKAGVEILGGQFVQVLNHNAESPETN